MQLTNISLLSITDSVDNIFIIKYKIFVGLLFKVNSSALFDSLLKFSNIINIIFLYILLNLLKFYPNIFLILLHLPHLV